MPIKNRLAELMPEIAEWRREIHMNPEIMFDLPKTTALVEAKLKEFGVDEIHTGIGRSGIVALIRGKSDTRGRCVGLRADMDALPMTEMTGLPYASQTPGKMHGCGHDGHTAMLLGAAKYLAETRNFDGTVALIFQPAEEGGGGGELMVKDGMMERFGIDEVYGMHNEPGLPVGEFGVSPGPIMAAADEFEVRIVGKGGHAARPHMCIDPTPAACNVVMALQTVASRNTDPIDRIVVSVCTIKTASEAFNVIPPEVLIRGTVRTLSDEVRDMAERRVTTLIHSTAEAYGCEARLEYHRGYPVVVNHDENAEMAAEIARAVAGSDKVRWGRPPRMGGEDFAYMLNARPGAFINVGNGNTAGVHHPEYDFNDEAIPYGCSFFAELVERRMPAS
ncbi:M20 family metallopeptidase [Roseibacterium sp. SDUM158016]|uniref:M20 aminoacylase family protein n=1 Tax=Roseicyclus sediminis TaxID=2980997 RepID=UPI0021CFF691|nr:M20 aminoacylase family protein [Roseibacterium sp. SDUM158016]MCU4653669.1 M20 family metallopeptidase [Roseibacterium sp. SDUM158016]